jgi:hypothetical protein
MAGLAGRQPVTDPGVVARIDLAAAFRLAARSGLHEGACNHFSLAVPGYRERACQLHLLAYRTGRPLRPLSDAVVRLAVQPTRTDAASAIDHLEALKRLLDRDEPDYAQ